MKLKKLILGATIFAALACRVSAAPLLFEGFETYNLGELDVDDASSPNNSTNNPWAGPFPINMMVVNTETNNGITITPHGGTNMIRGRLPSVPGGDFDQEYYNLEFWLNSTNGGAAFMGNFYLDWWFFDEVGTGTNSYLPSDYGDYIAVASYPNNPPDAPYNPALPTSGNGVPSVRLSLGGTGNQDAGYDGINPHSGWNGNVYQTRIEGNPTIGYNSGGWANLPAPRSVGWHHAHIDVLPQRADTTFDAALYIDDMVHPLMTPNFIAGSGFNCIEVNANFKNVSAYFDDITFDLLPQPTLQSSVSGTNVVVTWSHSWILQSSPGINPTSWTDVLDANLNYVTSPYTNGVPAGTQLYYRLRN